MALEIPVASKLGTHRYFAPKPPVIRSNNLWLVIVIITGPIAKSLQENYAIMHISHHHQMAVDKRKNSISLTQMAHFYLPTDITHTVHVLHRRIIYCQHIQVFSYLLSEELVQLALMMFQVLKQLLGGHLIIYVMYLLYTIFRHSLCIVHKYYVELLVCAAFYHQNYINNEIAIYILCDSLQQTDPPIVKIFDFHTFSYYQLSCHYRIELTTTAHDCGI